MPKPADVLAEALCHSHGNMHGPAAMLHADNQLDALTAAGFVVVPRLELSRMHGYIAAHANGRDDLAARRGKRILHTIRALLDPSNDDGEDA